MNHTMQQVLITTEIILDTGPNISITSNAAEEWQGSEEENLCKWSRRQKIIIKVGMLEVYARGEMKVNIFSFAVVEDMYRVKGA